MHLKYSYLIRVTHNKVININFIQVGSFLIEIFATKLFIANVKKSRIYFDENPCKAQVRQLKWSYFILELINLLTHIKFVQKQQSSREREHSTIQVYIYISKILLFAVFNNI